MKYWASVVALGALLGVGAGWAAFHTLNDQAVTAAAAKRDTDRLVAVPLPAREAAPRRQMRKLGAEAAEREGGLSSPSASSPCQNAANASRVAVRRASVPLYAEAASISGAAGTLAAGTLLDVSHAFGDRLYVRAQRGSGDIVGFVACEDVILFDSGPKRWVVETAVERQASAPAVPAELPPVATSAAALVAPSSVNPAAGVEPRKPGMSTKKKVAIAAAVTGAVIGAGILLKKYGLPGGGGSGGGGGAAAGSPSRPVMSSASPLTNTELLLFGGRGHKVFLGCLNCGEYDAGSVFNQYGTHGSAYSGDSIFNSYGDYGSPYSDYSACNVYASDPPVIVDRQGAAYGRLTLNPYAHQVASSETIAWLKGVCQSN